MFGRGTNGGVDTSNIVLILVQVSGQQWSPMRRTRDSRVFFSTFRNNLSHIEVAEYEFYAFNRISEHPEFDPAKKTILFFHGYFDRPFGERVQLITFSHLTNGGYNVITLNWADIVNGVYLTAVENADRMGEAIATIILKAFRGRMRRESLQLIGHSLGAQLAGNVGHYVRIKTKDEIKIER